MNRTILLIVTICLAVFANNDTNICEPECRFGFECVNGTCVSSCNPPCPTNFVCSKNECISLGKQEDILESQIGKVMLTTSASILGLAMVIVGFTIKENNEYRIQQSDMLGLRIGGSAIIVASIPLNILAWKKWKESNLYKKEYRKNQ